VPVVEAFKDMCSLFVCGKCGDFLKVASVDNEPANVCCGCGEENWNLVVKAVKSD